MLGFLRLARSPALIGRPRRVAPTFYGTMNGAPPIAEDMLRMDLYLVRDESQRYGLVKLNIRLLASGNIFSRSYLKVMLNRL